MSIKNTLVRKVVGVSLCAVIGFTGISLAQAPQASAATKAEKIISLGKKYMGVKYRFGAPSGSTSAFDCSSFTQYIYGKYGVKLPRVSSSQAKRGYKVAKSNLKKGDLVFFKVPSRTGTRIGHVGVYVGSNKMLHTYGKPGVMISSLSSSYWKKNYVTARRVL
ncbi:C40 family peptidase [Cohnella cholangitidis]|uniref:NlpC/P60 family protein n=1 Tax=Cohnella cholangitidis TaxID=2598458 RepID=A0A7G5C5W4_9BACL|nr:C40 family peptidase [Cohnella cholangitidis]QMV44598.1 NlpC/P60 family protein [Cohnella cholangitidis]